MIKYICLICIFLVAIKNLLFCPSWMGTGTGSCCFIMCCSFLRIWNLLLCLFFFRLRRPQCILISSSTTAALLDKQSNEYWNKNLIVRKTFSVTTEEARGCCENEIRLSVLKFCCNKYEQWLSNLWVCITDVPAEMGPVVLWKFYAYTFLLFYKG